MDPTTSLRQKKGQTLMICPNCKTSNGPNARFCSGCGSGLPESDFADHSVMADQELTREQSGQKATLLESGRDDLFGSTITGKYRIDAKLGAGGMGAVYRATRLVIGDEVAVKILHAEQSDPKAAERFRREAQAAARLKHPNAVTIHDFGITDDGVQYLVMELVEGESLRQIIKQQGPLTPSASVEIINQVCAALDEAHRHDIIHRDIKPDNIIVNVSTVGLHVKVLDFGIAKLRDDTASNLTQTGSILGTPHYMSPEQCLGEELDNRSDIYSLGVVLYEMLTGLVPFNSPTSAAVVVQQVTQPPPPLRSLNASISPAVEEAVLHALQKQRDARPQMATDFAQSFSSSVAGTSSARSQAAASRSFSAPTPQTDPTLVTPTPFPAGSFSTPASQMMKPARKRSSLSYVAVALGALVLGGIAVIFVKSGAEKGNTAQIVNATPNPNLRQSSGADNSRYSTPLRISATASSVRSAIGSNTYYASNAVDGKSGTAWVAGANAGIGEWIRFDFDREITLHRIIVQPGYFKSPRLWAENNRLAAVTADLSDGTSRELTFVDRMESQQFDTGAARTKWVRLVIRSVYYGTTYRNDTALSEVTFEWEP